MSPALAGQFFTTSTTWEAPNITKPHQFRKYVSFTDKSLSKFDNFYFSYFPLNLVTK